jgi:hypothetical protein
MNKRMDPAPAPLFTPSRGYTARLLTRTISTLKPLGCFFRRILYGYYSFQHLLLLARIITGARAKGNCPLTPRIRCKIHGQLSCPRKSKTSGAGKLEILNAAEQSHGFMGLSRLSTRLNQLSKTTSCM